MSQTRRNILIPAGILLLLALAGLSACRSLQSSGKYETEGMKYGKFRNPPPPEMYGTLLINRMSAKAGMNPVTFPHWVHRMQFTCRVCHSDLDFAMVVNGTEISAAGNRDGRFCGACHNGKTEFAGGMIFPACSKDGVEPLTGNHCDRCHASRDAWPLTEKFQRLTANFPTESNGNGINWEKAEELGLIRPMKSVPGVTLKKDTMSMQQKVTIEPKVEGMPDIIFSHKKHTSWNGCELCHPDLFYSSKKLTNYSMPEIFKGKYCGACHGSVAFPLMNCNRCHLN